MVFALLLELATNGPRDFQSVNLQITLTYPSPRLHRFMQVCQWGKQWTVVKEMRKSPVSINI